MTETWVPITAAPKDGRPVWARGINGGDIRNGFHYALVSWNEHGDHGPDWYTPAPEVVPMQFICDYMPDAFTGGPRIILQ